MNKTEYDNPLRQQCMSLPQLCAPQIAGVLKGLENALTDQQIKNTHRIIITGCGDSYVAAKAAVPAFKKFAGAFGFNVNCAAAIEVARYMEFDPRNNPMTLVIGISASGGPARVVEVLRRANAKGCMTLAITNTPDSPVAKEAGAALIVGTPAFPNPNPGLRNYYASLLGLYFLAAKMGEVMGRSKPGTTAALAEAITAYTGSYAPLLEGIDDEMFQLAQSWKDFKSYDFIGDDIQYSTAFFGAAKIVETCGKLTCTDDSEDWCHVNYFLRDPEKIGTTIVADVLTGNRSRVGETIRQAAAIGRPILLITNGTGEDYNVPAGVKVCTLPKAPQGYEFMLPLLDYLPNAILAGYMSTLMGESFFRGGGVWAEEGVGTIRTSKIEVV